MGYVPPFRTEEAFIETERYTVIVHALRENQRPIGYAPWPKQPKKKRRKKKL